MSILCQEMATNVSPTTTDHSTITSNFKLKASKNIIPLTSIFGYPAYTKFFLTIRILCGWRNIKRLRRDVIGRLSVKQINNQNIIPSTENTKRLVPTPFLDRGSAGKTSITQYRQLRRLNFSTLI